MFLNGLCYWFADILNRRFRYGFVVYDQVRGHFMWKYRDHAYDIEGEHEVPANAKTLTQIADDDPVLWTRIVDDCVLKIGYDNWEIKTL